MKRKIIPKHPYKTHGHYVTYHAVKRMNQRCISKGQLGYNLVGKPVFKSRIGVDQCNRLFYIRMDDENLLTVINPTNKNVCSVRRYHDYELPKRKKRKKTMIKIREKSIDFLKNYITNLNLFLPLDKDKCVDLIVEIEKSFVIPLSNAMGDGEIIDEELLDLAEDTIDDLNLEDLDFVDFNSRVM